MSESKFINTYIDVIIGTLHEHLNTILQLKTQQKLLNDLIQEKDEVISTLTREKDEAVENLQAQLASVSENAESSLTEKNILASEIESLRTNAKIWEESYTAMKNKVSHMDTLTNQLNQYKQDILTKNNEIDRLNKEIATLKSKPTTKEPQKETVKAPVKEEINSKSKVVKQEVVIPKTKTLDDF